MQNYPTIVNNIPKEKNHYSNTSEDRAKVDNKIAAGNMAIGESSNLAQLCLSYSYSFEDNEKYLNYTCILSVLAQCAIDNAKRTFDIDLNAEIKRIKNDMDIETNKYPAFWFILQRKNKFSKSVMFNEQDKQKKKEQNVLKTNQDLKCPMNYLYNYRFERITPDYDEIPIKDFFVKHPLDVTRYKSKQIEWMIQKYSTELYQYFTFSDESCPIYILEEDFDELIEKIKKIHISNKYVGLMSWLIDRAFRITPQMQSNKQTCDSNLWRNRPVLLKVLYAINPNALLKCFSKDVNFTPKIEHEL